MDSAINSARSGRSGAFPDPRSALRDHAYAGGILLAFRFADVRRAQALAGRRLANVLLRRAAEAFRLGTVMRATDLVAHEPRSDVFVVLLDRGRDGSATVLAPKRVRAINARMQTVLAFHSGLEIKSGWTYVPEPAKRASSEELIEEALLRGSCERARVDFFAAVGHELRSPLSSIRSYLDYLVPAAGGQPVIVDERKALDVVRHETSHLIRLVDALVDLSMLDFPNPALTGSGASLTSVVEGAIDAMRILAHQRGVTIACAPIPPLAIGLLPAIAEQVFVNLLDNAIKHGRAGGRIAVETHAGSGVVSVAISDDGPGIAPRDRERLFNRGIRGATRARGHGFGLAFVRCATEAAGGDVVIDDAPLGGARLTVRLPTLAPCCGHPLR